MPGKVNVYQWGRKGVNLVTSPIRDGLRGLLGVGQV